KTGAVTLTTTPTNSDGCSFLLAVPPGNYTITLTNSGHKDIEQQSQPNLVRNVVAGGSARYLFQFDRQGTYQLQYASHQTSPRPKLPTNLDTTFFKPSGQYTATVTADTQLRGAATLYPASTGYEVVAGKYVPYTELGQSCEAVDPAAWG